MESRDKIIRAKIQIQISHPFFAYLVLHLNIQEDIKGLIPEGCGGGIDKFGNLYYKKEYIDTLNNEECEGFLCHEVLHTALQHLDRNEKREPQVWNIATDLSVNNLLINNNFKLKNGLIPTNNTFNINGKEIKDIDKKSAEIIYDDIFDILKKNKKLMNELLSKGFDKHIIVVTDKNGKNGKSINKSNIDKWKNILVEATTLAKQRGELPLGIDRFVNDILNEKVDWKTLLYKYITRTIPIDYSYNYPSKKSISSGFYMPHLKREEVEITTIIDTSGSIGQEELTEFLSEIVGIAKSFNNIKIRVINCDYEVQNDLIVENGNIPTILDMKIKGGGGTSFSNALKYVEENYNNTKLVVYFTDGYGDEIENNYPFNLIWVLSKGGDDNLIKDMGEIIKL